MSTETANAARFRRQFPKLTPLESELLEALERLLSLCNLEVIEDSYNEMNAAETAISHAHGEPE